MRQRQIRAATLAAMALACAAANAQSIPATTVESGRIQGSSRDGVIAFLGIPYAAPPVGAARWRPPATVPHWDGTRDASHFSPSCPQILNAPGGRPPWTPEYLIPGAMSEDCLYLNVWRPADPALRNAPVLFFIHGGGNVEGSASVPVYDGAALARQGIVVVTINYRLGVLASLTLPALSQEQGGASGNYGFQDVVAALRWVHANAKAFGGDPDRITVAGQSAGAGAVTLLIASPAAKGLFARAITESGSQWGNRPGPLPLAEAERQGAAFAANIGTASLEQLRALSVDALTQQAAVYAVTHGRIGTVLDGHFVVGDPTRAPGFNDTPVLSGFNWEEDSGMDPKYGQWTLAELAQKRTAMFGPLAANAAALYPAATDVDARAVGKVMARERSRSLVYEWATHRAGATKYPIYIYFYHHPEPGPTQARYGTFHSSEVPYVFGNLDAPRPFTDDDRKVSHRMMARWVSFIKGATPNAPGLALWPEFNARKPTIMLLGDVERPEAVLPAEKIRLSDAGSDLTN